MAWAEPMLPVVPLTVMVKLPPSTGGLGSTTMELTLLEAALIVSCTELKAKSKLASSGEGGGPELRLRVKGWARAVGPPAWR